MGFRCELCDEVLPLFQFSHLCPTCYKLRTIVKCYDAVSILKEVESRFLVSRARELEERAKDLKFYQKEEEELQKEMVEKFKPSVEQIEAVKKIVDKHQVIADDTEKVKADEHNEIIEKTPPQPEPKPEPKLETIKEEVEPLPPLDKPIEVQKGIATKDEPINKKYNRKVKHLKRTISK